MDFRKNTNKFADPDFDGEPIPVEPKGGSKPKGTGTGEETPEPYGLPEEPELPNTPKYHVNGVDVYVSTERVQYYGPDGKLITESLIQYTKNNVKKEFHTAAAFSSKWNEGKKKEFIDSLVDPSIPQVSKPVCCKLLKRKGLHVVLPLALFTNLVKCFVLKLPQWMEIT